MTATRQRFELGARRELIEVPVLVPEQDEVSRAEGDSDWRVDGRCGQDRRGAVAFKTGSKPGLVPIERIAARA